ncbi:hypothetical protein FA13DRAFT_1729575 [Coprinellus micaceus]|uniref:Uncharacterized protein n=1 Tax=Coprinellus micaceus TaxID=71717 RepID=A0A4Y7TIW3_COPMI|nr:hypothetical protein FA13DRAFT_1729575 [Coprinellus micaceus]
MLLARLRAIDYDHPVIVYPDRSTTLEASCARLTFDRLNSRGSSMDCAASYLS